MPFEVFQPTMSLRRALPRTSTAVHVASGTKVEARPGLPMDITSYRVTFANGIVLDARGYAELTRMLKSNGLRLSDPWRPA